jgi:hypothetical protein
MSTEFSFENVFQAPSTATILAAYFDPDHLAHQDAVGQLGERTVVEHREDDAQRICTWSVVSLRQLPRFVHPFIEGGRLRYLEWMRWRKAADEIDLTIQPQILGGRVQIAATYQLAQVGEGRVRRRYKGTITANIPLLSGKIERGILAEIEKGMPSMFECTQRWLLERSGSAP